MRLSRISLPGTFLCLVWLLFPGCAKDGLPGGTGHSGILKPQRGLSVYTSYKSIPGVTYEEIDAIEALRSSGRHFVYAMTNSAECFEGPQGLGGFAVLYCQWLSDLFGIEFTPGIYNWKDLLSGLESGKIDFTGELDITPERLTRYYMTTAIAERPVTFVRYMNTPGPADISISRPPRLGFLENTTTRATVLAGIHYETEAINVPDAGTAYRMLREGQIDAFVVEGYEAEAYLHSDLVVAELLPHIYSSITMAARKTELAPIISVVQKYLDQGGLYQMIQLYAHGREQYLSYCFNLSLTEEERAYVEERSGINGKPVPIPVIMESSNYPTAFFNKTEGTWQGIAWDVLKEIEKISSLHFEVVSGEGDTFLENLAQLESGEGAMLSELLRSDERKSDFLWTVEPYSRDNFALLSKQETPDMGINEIFFARVGLITGTSQAELFHQWFPNHANTVEYPTAAEALSALKNGVVDLFMGSRNTLLVLTNYMEEPGFKANVVFYRTADSYFGFNKGNELLCSIINKAQTLVNTDLLENRWLSRIFDYRNKLVRDRQPYLIGFSILMGIAIFLLIALLQKYRESRQELETMVKFRTRELEERTEELEVQKNAVQTAYRVKSRFLANMSHEIRTPLNAIIGLSQEEMDKASPASRENLTSINRSGSVLLSVVNDLLDISNIESGEMKLKTDDYLLPALINDSTASARVRTGNKAVVFQLEVNKNLPIKLHGDKHRISQILGNLLSNAVKFTHKGSVVLRVDFETTLGANSAEEIQLYFEVRDTGIGINAADIQRIFTDYNQANTGALTGGTGMGLLITKKLAELMGGSIGAVSEYGRGSIFTARIPQRTADTAVLGAAMVEKLQTFNWKEEQEEKPCLSYARVLVVDDVPTNHAVARGLMKPYKLTVDAVLSGQEAVDLIARGEPHYDAIFMDHMMPGMDGVEATGYIRALENDYAKTIPIIALTANALPETEELFLSGGCNGFMTKPINVNVLTQMLVKWVRDPEKERLIIHEEEGEDEEEKEQESGALSTYSVEGVDLTAGAVQFGGAEAYLEIVKVFINDTPKLLEEIKNWLDGFRIMPAAAAAALESLKNYTITVHGIKGSCYGICAASVGDLAKELEMAAKNNDLTKVLTLNNRFVQATEKLVGELRALFPQNEKSKPQRNAPDPLLLQKLRDAARAYNINEMLLVLDELQNYEYREDGELVLALRKAAETYEYDDVVDKINEALEPENLLSGQVG